MADSQLVNLVLWLDIPVANLDRALTFYQALLNCDARDHRPNTSNASFQFSAQGSGLSLIEISDHSVNPTSITPYLNCQKRLAHATSQVTLHGGRILEDIHSMEPFGKRAVIEDSEGNRIALHSAE